MFEVIGAHFMSNTECARVRCRLCTPFPEFDVVSRRARVLTIDRYTIPSPASMLQSTFQAIRHMT
jgi:hypothetical protein